MLIDIQFTIHSNIFVVIVILMFCFAALFFAVGSVYLLGYWREFSSTVERRIINRWTLGIGCACAFFLIMCGFVALLDYIVK